jgi:hypothetical protein
VGHAYKVSCHLEIDWFVFGPFFSLWLALIWSSSRPSPLSSFALRNMVSCFAHFECVFHVFPRSPPANGQIPKLVEIVSSKALCLSLAFILAVFYVKVGG